MRPPLRLRLALLCVPMVSAGFAQGPNLLPLGPPYLTASVVPGPVPAGYRGFLTAYTNCVPGAAALSGNVPVVAGLAAGEPQNVPLYAALAVGSPICVVESYLPLPPAPPAGLPPPAPDSFSASVLAGSPPPPPAAPGYQSLCHYAFNDCDWPYSVVGGVEQSDLSAQNSTTDGFVDLIVRAPWNVRPGAVWLRVRFLGAPTNSSTQNVVAAATNPTGTITSSSLSTVGYAVDYITGYEHDWFQPTAKNPARGMFTLGLIAGFGATTPLSSQTATVGYAVPAYGTNECTQLHARFTAQNGYNPPLPGTGEVTTTTTVGSNAPTVGSPTNYCVVTPYPTSSSTSAGGLSIKTATDNTQITNIAFSPEDRSSFLLKYGAGIRLINRWHSGSSNRCSSAAANDHTGDGANDHFTNGPCTRSIVDFTFGQDQSITGGYLRRVVFKSDAIFPIPKSGLYFFASASIRIRPNQDLSPLILTSTPVSTSTGTAATGTVTIPSPTVFVLPLKQSDRDFYRIGLALDLTKILPKLFAPL